MNNYSSGWIFSHICYIMHHILYVYTLYSECSTMNTDTVPWILIQYHEYWYSTMNNDTVPWILIQYYEYWYSTMNTDSVLSVDSSSSSGFTQDDTSRNVTALYLEVPRSSRCSGHTLHLVLGIVAIILFLFILVAVHAVYRKYKMAASIIDKQKSYMDSFGYYAPTG